MNWRAVQAFVDRHPILADFGLALVAVIVSMVAKQVGPRDSSHVIGWGAVAIGVVAVAALTFRRVRPVPVLAILSCLYLAARHVQVYSAGVFGALIIAAFTVVLLTNRRTGLIVTAVAAGALLINALVTDGRNGFRPENLNIVVVTCLAAALGGLVRERRADMISLHERAERAERTRESEAARRVAEERLRIARDLHDVLAHHMAVVNVQTGVAHHLLETNPAAARTALGHARTAAGTVLDELGTVLGVLRRSGEIESTEPTPSLSGLPELVDPLRESGMNVVTTMTGAVRELPSAVDQAGYRVIQESLTNAHKHAAGAPVTVQLIFTEQALVLEIENELDAAAGQAPGSGFGITGMTERCVALGGTLRARAEPDGYFRVRATLPCPTETSLAGTAIEHSPPTKEFA